MEQHPEQQYLDMIKLILETGTERIDRTGVGTKAIFGHTMRFDLSKGFPVYTSKQTYWKTAFKEMLWMINGGDNIRELLEQNVHIWSEWPHKRFVEAHKKGSAENKISIEDFEKRILEDDGFAKTWGHIPNGYGTSWRKWKTADGREIDQLSQVVDMLKNEPFSRRILFEGYNVGEVENMVLPPCHKHYQFFVDPTTNKLHGASIMRSNDVFLGNPFNISNLALVTHMLSQQCGYEVGENFWVGLDTHLYLNHIEEAKELIKRKPLKFPKLVIKRKPESLFDYKIEDFELEGYEHHPPIKAPIAV